MLKLQKPFRCLHSTHTNRTHTQIYFFFFSENNLSNTKITTSNLTHLVWTHSNHQCDSDIECCVVVECMHFRVALQNAQNKIFMIIVGLFESIQWTFNSFKFWLWMCYTLKIHIHWLLSEVNAEMSAVQYTFNHERHTNVQVQVVKFCRTHNSFFFLPSFLFVTLHCGRLSQAF